MCFIPYALTMFILPHLSHIHMPYSYLYIRLMPSLFKKIKKISENGGVP